MNEAQQVIEEAILRASQLCPPGELPAVIRNAIYMSLGNNQLSEFFVLMRQRLVWS